MRKNSIIRVSERRLYGDIIDCVHKRKQPALDHPLFKKKSQDSESSNRNAKGENDESR